MLKSWICTLRHKCFRARTTVSNGTVWSRWTKMQEYTFATPHFCVSLSAVMLLCNIMTLINLGDFAKVQYLTSFHNFWQHWMITLNGWCPCVPQSTSCTHLVPTNFFFADMHMVVKFHSQQHSLMKSMVMLSVLYNTKNTWQVKKIRCNKSADYK